MHSRWLISFIVSSTGLQAYELSVEHFFIDSCCVHFLVSTVIMSGFYFV
jgi:hypothetical protein